MTDWAAEITQPEPPAPAGGATSGTDWAEELTNPKPMGGGQMRHGPVPRYVEGEDLSLMESAKELWTGDRRREFDLPEVPSNFQLTPEGPKPVIPNPLDPSTKTAIPIASMMSHARDNDMARAEIFQKQVPDANVYWDENMNPYTDYFGEMQYLNRPGASSGDLPEVVNATGEMVAAGLGAKGLGNLGGPIFRMLGAGAGLGGASISQDQLARSLGSKQPTDWKRAQIMAYFGVGGEAASILLSRFFARMAASRKLTTPAGELTDRGRQIVERQGIDPDLVNKDFIKSFEDLVSESLDPKYAARLAAGRALPHNVRLSKGDVTQDVTQQAFEASAEAGAKGEGAKNIMVPFREGQQDDLYRNVEAIRGQVGGKRPPSELDQAFVGEGMEPAMGKLDTMQRTMYANMKAAYEQAGRSGASVAIDGVRTVHKTMMDELARSFNPNTAQKTFATLMDASKQLTPRGARVKQVNIKSMENMRQQLSALSRSSDQVEAQAARTAVRMYDKAMEEVVRQGFLHGDEKALQFYKQGRQLRAQMAEYFESNKLVEKIMTREGGKLSDLALTPQEAMNVLFTANKLAGKGAGKAGTVDAVKRMKNLLGENSMEWKALKQEAVTRLFRQAQGTEKMATGARKLSGDRFDTAFREAMYNSRGLMKELFTDHELGILEAFRSTMLRATSRQRGAVNYSNSYYAMARDVLDKQFGALGKFIRDAIDPFLRQGEQASAAGRAGEAVNFSNIPGNLRQTPVPVGGIGGLSGVGAAAGMQGEEELRKRNRRLQMQ